MVDIKNPHNVTQFTTKDNDLIMLFYVISQTMLIRAVIVIEIGIMIKINSYG